MNAQTAVNALTTHLLGENWYIEDPVNNEQANKIIVDEIMSRYRAVDKDPVEKYRRKHKKCMWCKHCESIIGLYSDGKIHTCSAKGLKVNPYKSHYFCKLFQLKKEK